MKEREFRKELVMALRKALGEQFQIIEQDCNRINHVEELGISIKREGKPITPVIPIKAYFQEFKENKDIAVIVKKVLQLMEDYFQDTKSLHKIFDLENWEESKKRLRVRLINTKKNQAILEKVPHVPFLNLSAIFFLRALETENSVTTLVIDNRLQKKYGVTLQEMMEQAMANVEKETVLMDIDAAFGCMISGENNAKNFTAEDAANSNTGVFVLSNYSRMNGCAGILSKKVRQNLVDAFRGQNLIIFPSSIHELILLPDTGERSKEELLEIVQSANRSVVKENDFLADAVYQLNGETGEVELLIEEENHDRR